MIQAIKDALSDIPQLPGVYLMKDISGEIIYIGKAKNLKNRVKSYFLSGKGKSIKTMALVEHVKKLDWVVTDSEYEAFALESNLIKQFMPRYNIMLKDDKHYPYIKIDLNDDYPKIDIVRRVKKDGAKYYGPYFDVTSMRTMVEAVNKTFKIRTCNKNIAKIKGKERPCLEYDIGRCTAPCLASVKQEDYRQTIMEVVDFLSGNVEKVQSELTAQMLEASDNMEFEKAAQFRDRLEGIKLAQNQGQRVIATSKEDFDLFAVYHSETDAVVQALIVRSGKVIGTENFDMDMPEGGDSSEVLEYLITSYYSNQNFISKEIYVSDDLYQKEEIEQALTQASEKKVSIKVPLRGKKKSLVDMAKRNAQQELERIKLAKARKYERTGGAVISLKEELGLAKNPVRIEGFDISNIQGVDTVASMVVFEKGVPCKKDYRRFKIKNADGPDDFKSMAEVIRRRFERLHAAEGEKNTDSFSKTPDLVLIDGGKGQLASARSVMNELGYGSISTIGLAKREEEVFVGDEHRLVVIEKRAPALHLLQRIRDEAHRFAITYHKSLRGKNSFKSILEEIEGIGPKRRKALLMAFPTISAIKNAGIDELLEVEGLGESAAKAVYEYFNTGKDTPI